MYPVTITPSQVIYTAEEVEEIVSEYREEKVCESYLDKYCSCMVYLQTEKGIDISGNAIDIEPNYFGEPQRGDVIIFRYPNGKAHTAFLEEVYNEVYWISEWNYFPAEKSERRIPFELNSIYGIYRDYSDDS